MPEKSTVRPFGQPHGGNPIRVLSMYVWDLPVCLSDRQAEIASIAQSRNVDAKGERLFVP